MPPSSGISNAIEPGQATGEPYAFAKDEHGSGRRRDGETPRLPILKLSARASRWFWACFVVLVGMVSYAWMPRVAIDSPLGYTTGIVCGLLLSGFARTRGPFVLGLVLLMGTALVTWATTSAVIHHERYFGLLGPETDAPLAEKLPKLNLDSAPLVSQEMALLAAQRRLSELSGIGSVAEVVRMDKQVVKGQLVWIGMLEHKRFASWWSSGVTPGYVRVNANDPSDVDLVTETADASLKQRYLRSAYFGDNLTRHIRSNGFMTVGLADYTYEVDEDGRPWAAVTTFEPTIGVGGRKVTGVVLVDVQSGVLQHYLIDKVPSWVDRVYPSTFVVEQVGDRLEYVRGWFNPSKTDELRLSGTPDLVYENGHAEFIVGLTSTSKEGGLVGIMTIDSRTKEVFRHSIAGATEDVARAAIENVNPEKRYKATNPLPFMVAGRPSYVMTLRDANGVARSFGIVDIEDVQHLATGETLATAVRLYQTRMAVNRTVSNSGPGAVAVTAHAQVERISAEVRDGNTGYTLVISGYPGKLFIANANLSEELAVTQPGDIVQLSAVDNGTRALPVASFLNETLKQQTKFGSDHGSPSSTR